MNACLTTNSDIRIHEPLFAEIKGCSLAKIDAPRVECMFGEIDAGSPTNVVSDIHRC